MTKLPVISARECIRALERAGYYISHQKGSHITMRREDPYGKVIIPNHKTLKPATLRSILRQADVSVGFTVIYEKNAKKHLNGKVRMV